jgi:hypothetical protein
MIHPISSNVNNAALYFGTKLATDKDSPPKTETTNSSASASARGDNGTEKTGVTSSSANKFAQGTPPVLDTKPIKNTAPAQTIAPATASFNTPSVDITAALNADSEKEYKEAKAGKTKEAPVLKADDALKVLASQEQKSPTIITLKNSVSAEAVISAYK